MNLFLISISSSLAVRSSEILPDSMTWLSYWASTSEQMSGTRLLLALPRLVRQRRSFSTQKGWLHPGLCWSVATRHEDERRERGWICYSARERWVGSLRGCRTGRQYFHVADHDSTCHFVLIRCPEGEQAGQMEQWSFTMFLLMIIYNTVRSRMH